VKNENELPRLIKETYRALCYFLRYLGVSEAELDDMAQDVYIKAFNAFDRYDQNRPFKSWLFSIAKNTFIDWTRKQKTKRKFLENNFIKDYSETFENDSNSRADIKALISELSAEEQILVELRFFQDLPFKEVSELTGLTPGAVKMRIFRIIAKMKASIKRENNEQSL
jgi:RNA polymerase sigma-70 factor (ECF subfamily)